MFALNILVKAAFVKGSDSKIFGFIGQLQRSAIGDLKKGYCKGSELWVMRINKLVNKVVSEIAEGQQVEEGKLDTASMCKIHKKNIKFAEKTIESIRIEVE